MTASLHNQPVDWQGTRYRSILPASASGGEISIFESLSPPRSGPPRHVHAREDETFHVLSGEVTFWLEGALTSLGPGGAIHVPRGVEHAFLVTAELPAHAHLNLIGWSTLGLFGIYYHLVPYAGETLLARIHFAVATGGVLLNRAGHRDGPAGFGRGPCKGRLGALRRLGL